MVVLQIQQLNGFVNYASRDRKSRGRGRASTKVCVQTQVAPSRTQRIMEKIAVGGGEAGGAGGVYSYNALKRLDNIWSNICTQPKGPQETKQIVSRVSGFSQDYAMENNLVGTFDIAVCGGTLGIFLATALCAKGLRVAVVERNAIRGRDQEWNISRKEMKELIEVGVLTEEEIEDVIAANFNPNRCGFENLGDIWVEDILNLGVSPAKLVETVKQRFISLGGVILEDCSLSSITIYDDLAVMQLSKGEILSSRLVIDAMGNFSPILKQIKGGRKPDGMCLVVGSCAHGFKENSSSDVIYSSSSVTKVADANVQLFWEAFPAGSGPLDRTTYMFTYTEPQSTSPSLEDLLEEYWKLMPTYQGVSLDELEILRVVYGIFPTYKNSPLQAAFDRVLQFGDASGIQSPVSFGGFGSLTRHLGRLSNGIYEAIDGDILDSDSLSKLNPYMPNLSASWLFQRAMSAKQNLDVSPSFTNELLHVNFSCMQRLGESVLRPFLQDVIQFGPLAKTLGLVMLTKPQIIPSIFKQVGIHVLLDWSVHFFMLGLYTFLSAYIDPVMRPSLEELPLKTKFQWKRRLEAWKYGAGLDYEL
ncbi:Lycopene beta/epsilon cyclase protein [Hirschfeldia incana]|nr:Lycopene beta/epsilon cyclase protein [Hirschfeldia incana]